MPQYPLWASNGLPTPNGPQKAPSWPLMGPLWAPHGLLMGPSLPPMGLDFRFWPNICPNISHGPSWAPHGPSCAPLGTQICPNIPYGSPKFRKGFFSTTIDDHSHLIFPQAFTWAKNMTPYHSLAHNHMGSQPSPLSSNEP